MAANPNAVVSASIPANSPPKYRAWSQFKQNKAAAISLIILIVLILLALLAPVIAPHDPIEQDLIHKLKPPSIQHWLGTDELGRDMFSRLLYGARVSLAVGIYAVLFNLIIGVTVGALAGYYGGKIDGILMRFVDIMLAFPSFFALITVVSLLKPSLFNIIAVLVAFGWMTKARLLRGQIMSVRNREYIDAARTIGMSDFRIIFRHVLPNAIAPVIVASTIQMGSMILSEAGLSFLGLGIQPPTASWGNMLQGALNMTVMMKAPWVAIAPGLVIFITILSFNFVGDGLRNALDSK